MWQDGGKINVVCRVYVSFGSLASFSYALIELEMEVKPLWEHRPCPKYFKKASYERFFRQRGFAIDWCNFKLVSTLTVKQMKPICVELNPFDASIFEQHTNERKDALKTTPKQNAAIVSLFEDAPHKLIRKGDVSSI